MPVKSKAQLRFFQALRSGTIKKESIPPMVANEYLKEVPKRLPERTRKGKKK